MAEIFAEVQGADLYEIVLEQPYTDEDLNYNDSSTRATVEQNDENARPAISGSVENIEDYDVIYVGFLKWSTGLIVYRVYSVKNRFYNKCWGGHQKKMASQHLL